MMGNNRGLDMNILLELELLELELIESYIIKKRSSTSVKRGVYSYV